MSYRGEASASWTGPRSARGSVEHWKSASAAVSFF
jgi:hypothetical protein